MKKILFIIFSLATTHIFSQDFPLFISDNSNVEESVVFNKYSNEYKFIIVKYHKFYNADKVLYEVIGFKEDKVKKIKVKQKVSKNKIRSRKRWIWFWDKRNYYYLPKELDKLGLLSLNNEMLNKKHSINSTNKIPSVHLYGKEYYYFEIINGKNYKQIYSYCPQEYAKIFREHKELQIFLDCIEIFDRYWE